MTWTLPTAVIGPKAQGRNYGLRRYAGPRLTSEAQARINDFAMSLTGWAILRLDRLAAMLPLTADSFALVRARHLGEGELGPVAVAHLVIVPRELLEAIDWASHRLLRLVPEPEDATFALAPLTVAAQDLAAPAAHRARVAPRAGWSDLAVDAGGSDPEALLVGLMEAIDPPAQRARLTGWATTSLLARAGGLDPAQLFKLVVHDPAESLAAFAATHQSLSLDAALSAGEPPLAWKAWLKLAAIAEREPAAAALRAAQWAQDKARLPAGALMFEEIARACAELAPAGMVGLLRAVARHAAGEDAVAAALRHGVSETFDALVAVADAEGAAFYVDRYLDGATPEEAAIPAGLNAVVARPAVAAWLGDAAVRLDLTGVTALWSARLAADQAFGDSLAAAAPTILDSALQIALLDAGRTEARRLAARLLRLHCARLAPDPALIRLALGVLLGQPPSDADIALADPKVVQATEALAPALSTALAERAVLPAMRAARRREDLHRAAWALLAANDAGGAP